MAENIDAERAADRDVLDAFNDWMARRGPLGAGASPERIFIAGWAAGRRTPSTSIGEDGLPELPANVAHVTRRIRRCESDVPAQVVFEHFARQYAREAIAADRRAREEAGNALNYILPHEVTVTNYGNPVDKSPQAAQGVKTWQERCNWMSNEPATKLMVEAMKAEIVDLRAQLARQSRGVPDAVRAAGAKMANTMFNLAQRCGDLIDGDLAASMDQMRKEWDATVRSMNRAAPPLSSEQQAEKGADDVG